MALPYVFSDEKLKESIMSLKGMRELIPIHERRYVQDLSEVSRLCSQHTFPISDLSSAVLKLKSTADGFAKTIADGKQLLDEAKKDLKPKLIDYIKNCPEGIVCKSTDDVIAVAMVLQLTGVATKVCVGSKFENIEQIKLTADEYGLEVYVYDSIEDAGIAAEEEDQIAGIAAMNIEDGQGNRNGDND